MKTRFLLGIFVILILSSSCRRRAQSASDLTDWSASEITTQRKILNSHVTANNELYLMTEEEFIRVGTDDRLLEQRPLVVNGRIYGRSMLSDWVFSRITKDNTSNEYILDFSLVRNSNAVQRIRSSELGDEGELILFETLARNTGDFNADGNQFILPAISFPNNFYTFFIFNIELNSTNTQFIDIQLSHRVDVPELPFDIGNLHNTRFINGNYYVSAWNGAYRITPEGTYTKFSSHWAQDFFEYNDNVYATGVAPQDFFFSPDNGVNWLRAGNESQLQMIKVANDHVFSHQTLGFPYKMADSNLHFAEEIVYDSSFPDDNALYFDIGYFDDQYYITINNTIYYHKGDFLTR